MPDSSTAQALTEHEAAILAFERSWWTHGGGKEPAIRERFGLDTGDYYRLLNELLDRPAALAVDPLLVRRLRRQRLTRQRERSARRTRE